VTNTTIGSAAWNATQADYVTALAHTASTTRALYPTTAQVQDGALLWGGTAGGTADALTITLTPAITAYATGQVFRFIAASTNATAATSININGVGVKTIKRQNAVAIQAGDILAGAVIEVAYNGTDFLLTGVTAGQASSLGVILYSSRTSNTLLVAADRGYFVDITSGTFTQTFGAASALGSGWWLYLRNGGTGDVELQAPAAVTTSSVTSNSIAAGTTWTVATSLSITAGDLVIVRRTADPFAQRIVGTVSSYNSGTGSLVVTVGYRIGSGTYTDWTITTRASTAGIDGLATFIMYPGEVRLIQCDGTAFRSIVVESFLREFNVSGTFTKPPGYSQFGVRAWSGGASGQKSGATGTQASGGGGGGCGDFILLASTVGATETATIGAGGAAVTSTALGNVGGNTTLGSLISIFGSPSSVSGGSVVSGMLAQSRTANGFEGAGSQATTALCSSVYGGSASPVNSTVASGNAIFGGAAGGGVDTTATVQSPGVSVQGGNGGAASSASSGTAGSQPGGGGGATQTGTASGAGGSGAIRIWGLT
jgi:hypothetical protein